MNFVSLQFWLILSVFLIFYLGIKKLGVFRGSQIADRLFLLIVSLTIFGLEDVESLTIFLLISFFIFFCIKTDKIISCGSSWSVLVISLTAVSPLLYFKYRPLVMTTGEEAVTFSELVIPIGLSFYTFQLLSLFFDQRTQRLSGENQTSQQIKLLDFLNFAAFFPQIVAGPIERKKDLLPQVQKFRLQLKKENVEKGMKLIVLGLTYKLVIADSIASETVWITKPIDHPLIVHFANILFGIRIYGDFCGYSLIAVGIAKTLGVKLTHNFNSPYTQVNIQKFWRGWHITLTNWFRDYIYIPLGGNRTWWTVIAVFAISGVWHGAGWNFILWGLVHGFMVLFVMKCGQVFRLPSLISWLVTMIAVSFSWLFFYQWELTSLRAKIASILNPAEYFSNPFTELLRVSGGEAALVCLALFTGLGCGLIFLEYYSQKKYNSPYAWSENSYVQMTLIFLIVVTSPIEQNGFVYFSF